MTLLSSNALRKPSCVLKAVQTFDTTDVHNVTKTIVPPLSETIYNTLGNYESMNSPTLNTFNLVLLTFLQSLLHYETVAM